MKEKNRFKKRKIFSDIKFATSRAMSEIKCSQNVANSQMKRAKKEGKIITKEYQYICGGGENCPCGGGGAGFTAEVPKCNL